MRKVLAALVGLLVVLGIAAFGATRSAVDPRAAACTKTVSKGSEIAGALSEGGTVCLTAGTYPRLELDNVKPSSATLEPVEGASVTIDGIQMQLDSNLTVKGLNLKGIYLEQGDSYITIEDDTWRAAECGVFAYGWEGYEVEHITIKHNLMEDLNFSGSEGTCSGAGVVMIGHVKDFTIDNNQIGPGIAGHYTQTGGIEGLQENGNTFLGPSNHLEHGSADHQNVFQDFGESKNVEFDDNVLRHTGTNGGSILLEHGQMKNVQLDNNLFEEDAEGYSVQIYPTEGLEFAHNTVVNSHWGVYFRAAEPEDETHGDDYTVTDNVVVGNTGGTPDLTELGCSSSCDFSHNATSDGSADGEGSVDDWKPSWRGDFFPVGLPFAARSR
jgi:hypothetical protein